MGLWLWARPRTGLYPVGGGPQRVYEKRQVEMVHENAVLVASAGAD